MKNLIFLIVVGLMTLVEPRLAKASGEEVNIPALCLADKLVSYEASRGRNLWAIKCRYIDQKMAEYLNERAAYPSFSERIAPVDPEGECGAKMDLALFCLIGR